MKLLVILCNRDFNIGNIGNIKILNDYLLNIPDISVDYCGISNSDDFHNYESIIKFKYKVVNPKKQINKICDFISEYEIEHDWFMKIRPDIEIIEMFDFNLMSDKAINARAREYRGTKQIKYGMSVGGPGCWREIIAYSYNDSEIHVVLDDMLFIFHSNIIKLGGFDKLTSEPVEDHVEVIQTGIWNDRKIPLNVVGLNIKNTKHGGYSGNINM